MTTANKVLISSELENFIAESKFHAKVRLVEMKAWVDSFEDPRLISVQAMHDVYDEYPDKMIRELAVIRQLSLFLSKCLECPNDIATVFRAVEHRKSWRRR